MDINKIDSTKVKLVRENINYPILEPEDEEKFDHKDPDRVFDWLVDKSDRGDCECAKCTGTDLICTTNAVMFHDLLENKSLEWSDAQKGAISEFVYITSCISLASVFLVDEKAKESASKLIEQFRDIIPRLGILPSYDPIDEE